MRKISLVIFAIALIVSFSSCSSSVSSPEEIGKQVFNILKDFEVNGEEAFFKKHLTFEKVRALAKNDKVSTDIDFKNELTSTSIEEITTLNSDLYNAIRGMGHDNGIHWNNIQFLDFTYELEYEKDAKYIEDVLFITHSGEVYKFSSYSLWDGNEYVLLTTKPYF